MPLPLLLQSRYRCRTGCRSTSSSRLTELLVCHQPERERRAACKLSSCCCKRPGSQQCIRCKHFGPSHARSTDRASGSTSLRTMAPSCCGTRAVLCGRETHICGTGLATYCHRKVQGATRTCRCTRPHRSPARCTTSARSSCHRCGRRLPRRCT